MYYGRLAGRKASDDDIDPFSLEKAPPRPFKRERYDQHYDALRLRLYRNRPKTIRYGGKHSSGKL